MSFKTNLSLFPFKFQGHDSTLSIGSPSLPEVLQIKLPALPATNLFFTSNSMIVATGYDCIPYIFKNDGMGKW